MDPDATFVFNVFDQSKVAKAIHEEADAGTGGADHLCQSFLRDRRHQVVRFIRIIEFGQDH